jgi:hypothetical protein
LKFVKCYFIAPRYTLYNEMKTTKPMPHPGAMNLTFQVGLSKILEFNVPPQSRSNMQRSANTVGTAAPENENEEEEEEIVLNVESTHII